METQRQEAEPVFQVCSGAAGTPGGVGVSSCVCMRRGAAVWECPLLFSLSLSYEESFLVSPRVVSPVFPLGINRRYFRHAAVLLVFADHRCVALVRVKKNWPRVKHRSWRYQNVQGCFCFFVFFSGNSINLATQWCSILAPSPSQQEGRGFNPQPRPFLYGVR